MQYKVIPEGMYSDLALEQKVEEMTKLNRDMMVKDTFSEEGSPS